jgi:hypothetical protein
MGRSVDRFIEDDVITAFAIARSLHSRFVGGESKARTIKNGRLIIKRGIC